jgi:hypothetical protein
MQIVKKNPLVAELLMSAMHQNNIRLAGKIKVTEVKVVVLHDSPILSLGRDLSNDVTFLVSVRTLS